MRRPERVHVADPFGEIEGDRKHGQDGDQPHHDDVRSQRSIEVEALLGQDERGEEDLRTVLTFEIASGRIGIGLPISQDSMKPRRS